MLWLLFARAGYTPRPVADDGIQHLNEAPAPKFVFDRSARGDSSHQCPKCGMSSDGKSNCCSEGGSWQGQCTLTLGDGGQHTWSDGYDACDDSITLHVKAGTGKVAANCADWCSHWTVLAPECAGCQQGTNLAAGTAPGAEVLAAGAAVPEGEERLEIQARRCRYISTGPRMANPSRLACYTSTHIRVCICIYIVSACICICTHIYIYRERERERKYYIHIYNVICIHICNCICTCICI